MTTVILVGLIVVLLAAAAYVGVLLVRRTRSARAEPGPDDERPRTVADLVKRRMGPELSGDELFVPAVPRQDGLAVPAAPDDASVEPEAAPPSPELATPAGGLEVGDAPWRRAARMAGAEPGGTWATAPLPVVAENTATGDVADADQPGDRPASASSSVVIVSRAAATPTAATLWGELEAMRAAAARPEPPVPESEQGAAEPALDRPAAPSPWTEPTAPAADVAEQPAAVEQPSTPAPVSRRLSDPDLTPLMGIPIIRPAADAPADDAGPEPLVEAVADEPDVAEASDVADVEPVAAPVPRTVGAPTVDDDVVFLVPPTPTGSFPVVRPAASGSAQPVWFRVVRRDGEPVSAAVVALLDDHGREVDTTKTAPDGGGELRTPHGGRFMMIVSADGYQPRAAILSVDDEPVELALLLPRSAAVSGSVRTGGAAMRDARVVVRQDHEVVDEGTTGGDGHYRFDDLAEGTYVVAVTAGASRAVARVSLAEGADVRVDLDLAGTADAR